MSLQTMRKKHVKIVIWVIIISFISTIFFVWGMQRTKFNQQSRYIAKVDDIEISYNELINRYQNRLQQLQRNYDMDISDEQKVTIRDNVLEEIIQEKILLDIANKLNFTVTDYEVVERIKYYPQFWKDGKFDRTRWQQTVQNVRVNWNRLLQQEGPGILLQKVKSLIYSSTLIPEYEIKRLFIEAYKKAKFELIRVKFEDFKKRFNPKSKQIKNYYINNQELYRVPTKVKIGYLTFSPIQFEEDIELDENTIKTFFDKNKDKYSEPAQIKASHILFKVPKNASEQDYQTASEKAQRIYERIQNGEDFAELAKTYSEGPTGAKGGDLGFFGRGKMVKEFEDAAFNLKVGQVSGLVRTQFGIHIIKKTDEKEAKPAIFSAVQDKVEQDLRQTMAAKKAEELVNQVKEEIIDFSQFEDYVKEHPEFYNETAYFSENAYKSGMYDESFVNTAFKMSINEISQPLKIGNSYLILHMLDKKMTYIPELEEIEETVIDDVKLSLADTPALKYSTKIYNRYKTRKNQDLEKIASKYRKAEFESFDYYYAHELSDLFSPEFNESIFYADTDVLIEPIKVNDGYAIAKVIDKVYFDTELYTTYKSELEKESLRSRQYIDFENWYESTKRNYKIVYNDMLLKKMFE